jgi:FtsZ-interacting cell division protein ZipA
MKMKSRDLIFIAIVILVVGGLWWLSTRNKAKAMLPTPPEHLTAKSRDDCFKCHLPKTLEEMELQHKHPNKWRDESVDCTRCHKPPREANAMNLNTRQINELATLLRRETREDRRSRIED